MRITVNELPVTIRSKKVYGAHVRNVANVPPHHLILRETPGKPDELIRDDTPVVGGQKFTTHPPSGYGG